MAGAFFFRQPLAPAHATARGPAARHQHRATSPSSSNTAARAENHEAKAAILHHCAERKKSRSQSPGADSGAGVPTSPALGVNGPGTSTQHHSDHSDMALCVASQGFHTIPPKSTSSIHLHPQTFYTPSQYAVFSFQMRFRALSLNTEGRILNTLLKERAQPLRPNRIDFGPSPH